MKKRDLFAFIEAGKKKKAVKNFKEPEKISMKITREQGRWAQYQLRLKNTSFADVANEVGCRRQAVHGVVSGMYHSKRIEAAVAQRLGYKSWNDMVRRLREGGCV